MSRNPASFQPNYNLKRIGENVMKIVVVGLGYVGLSNAVLLSQHNEVVAVDISQERVDAINAKKSPISDVDLSRYLEEKELDLRATTDLTASFIGADYVVVSTPTNYDEEINFFDTSSVEEIIAQVIATTKQACIVVKSTIPVGFIDRVREKFETELIMFSPEFLREGKALKDNLYPSRIIVGDKSVRAKVFASLLAQGAVKTDVNCLFTGTREAEAIKLFSNCYLAMRVAFFNELDSYALSEDISSREIITGVSHDPRIGFHYNNPSFGYGGYCLPKDTKQLLSNFRNVPQNLIGAIVNANSTRKDFLADQILKKNPKIVGIYRLIMKHGSDNFRESSVKDIVESLTACGVTVNIFEPDIKEKTYLDAEIVEDLEEFKQSVDVIVANRLTKDLEDVSNKVFSRDLFNES